MRFIFVSSVFFAATLWAQGPGARLAPGARVDVSLEVMPSGPLAGRWAAIQANPDGSLSTVQLGGLEIVLSRFTLPQGDGLVVQVPEADPPILTLLPGQAATVALPRPIGRFPSVSYSISYWRSEDRANEVLSWASNYRAEGKLVIGDCRVSIFVADYNGDGVFDPEGDRGATTLTLDLNDDGNFFGQGEHAMYKQIIEACGVPLEAAELDPSGQSISFVVSEVRPPALGDKLPAFTISSVDGELLQSRSLLGKVHVLDFWASWCKPCVSKMLAMEQISRDRSDKVAVIGINVDQPARRAAAERIVAENSLTFPQVIRAQGADDFLWKLFGSMEQGHLSIPLYVVSDPKGVIRYASHGGDDLEELTAILDELTGP